MIEPPFLHKLWVLTTPWFSNPIMHQLCPHQPNETHQPNPTQHETHQLLTVAYRCQPPQEARLAAEAALRRRSAEAIYASWHVERRLW